MALESSSYSNFARSRDYDKAYWREYLQLRPKYERDGFYNLIYAYQEAHNGPSITAHDVGTGPGQVAEAISKRFQHVIASDASSGRLDVCKQLNPAASSKFGLVQCKGEELAKQFVPGSADAIFCAETIQMMDSKAAVKSFSKLLRPNGTAAIWVYTPPAFADGNKRQCQDLFERILDRLHRDIIVGSSPAELAKWKASAEMLVNGLDGLKFSSNEWKDVRRYKWNSQVRMGFHGQDGCNFPIRKSSAVGDEEEVIKMPNQAMWASKWDSGHVRRFLHHLFPSFDGYPHKNIEAEELYDQLEQAMGGEGARRTMIWPVALVLATKK